MHLSIFVFVFNSHQTLSPLSEICKCNATVDYHKQLSLFSLPPLFTYLSLLFIIVVVSTVFLVYAKIFKANSTLKGELELSEKEKGNTA